jgi:hypothetical protein
MTVVFDRSESLKSKGPKGISDDSLRRPVVHDLTTIGINVNPYMVERVALTHCYGTAVKGDRDLGPISVGFRF